MNWLLKRLRKHKENRGMMANLRCVLVDSKKHRAWPVLNRLGVDINDDITPYIAGLFATHPEETSTGNFGATCKAIEQQRHENQGDDNRLTPTERRFQHLLTADRKEIKGRVLRVVLMAKSQGVPINYVKLAPDLKYWPSERTKNEWATAFWSPAVSSISEEAS